MLFRSDLISQHLSGNHYSGKSRLIRNDPYNLRFAFPPGKNFSIKSATAGGLPVRIANHEGWAEVEITSPKTKCNCGPLNQVGFELGTPGLPIVMR